MFLRTKLYKNLLVCTLRTKLYKNLLLCTLRTKPEAHAHQVHTVWHHVNAQVDKNICAKMLESKKRTKPDKNVQKRIIHPTLLSHQSSNFRMLFLSIINIV